MTGRVSSFREPPEGWVGFGSHADGECPHHGGPLEFSDEKGEDCFPRWERHDDCHLVSGRSTSSTARADVSGGRHEAALLLPALWKAHEYLRREDAPDANKVNVALGILDRALQQWTDANPSPDDEDQDDGMPALWKDCCMTLRYERGHSEACHAV